MGIYTKGIDAGASTDAGNTVVSLTSTEEEVKKVRRLIYYDVGNNAMLLSAWLEREEIAQSIPLEVMADAKPERIIDFDLNVPVGQTFSIVLKPQSSDSQGKLDGYVEYEITG